MARRLRGDRPEPFVNFNAVANLRPKSPLYIVPITDFVDDLTWFKGRHTLQFGGNCRLITETLNKSTIYKNATVSVSNLVRAGIADWRTMDLTKAKTGSARTLHLNADSVAAFPNSNMNCTNPPIRSSFGKGLASTLAQWFAPCLQDAEIEGYVWHCHRDAFCSWLAMAGAFIKEIQELAGHKTITLLARYSHLSPEHWLSVIDRIASHFAD